MGIPILGDIIDAVGDLASEVLVDKDKKNEIKFELEKLKDQHAAREHEAVMGQIETNQAEAKHASIFVAGWRPFVGWACGFGLVYATIVLPLMSWIATVIFGYAGDFPEFETMLLITILGGMLGLSTNRMFEAKWGVKRNSLKE